MVWVQGMLEPKICNDCWTKYSVGGRVEAGANKAIGERKEQQVSFLFTLGCAGDLGL